MENQMQPENLLSTATKENGEETAVVINTRELDTILKKASENYPDLYSSMSFKNNHVTIKTFVSVISEEIERSVNVGLVRKLF